MAAVDARSPTCDILILVATDSEESALVEVASELALGCERRAHPALGEYFDLGTVGKDRVFAVRTCMGAIRHEGSAHKSLVFLAETHATALIQVGMAFGIDPTQQTHGDVLVGSAVIPYDDRDVRERDGHVYVDYERMRRRSANKALLTLFEREAARAVHGYDVHVGALLSGSARIFSATFRDQLRREVPPGKELIVGGEMEAVGLLVASPADRPLWAIVKGISDFADAGRDAIIEQTRGPACRNAASFVLSALLHRDAVPQERS